MPDAFRCFVNERPLLVAAGATVRDAVGAYDPALAERLMKGEAYVTDARALRLPADGALTAGAILRVIVSSRAVVDDPDA